MGFYKSWSLDLLECCSVHRNLGRATSFVRHLRRSFWDEQHFKLMVALTSNHANRIWESAINEPNSKARKPRSNDPIYPHKDTFIREKYVKLAFLSKKKGDDTEKDSLNRQLFSCVRSEYVNVTLRLIALGADVNYVDPETGETPLHVAARESSELQIELLFLFGCSLGSKNNDGDTAKDVVVKTGNSALENRFSELEYYATDRFSLFLCGRKPTHWDNKHFLIPDLMDKSFVGKTLLSRNCMQLVSDEHLAILRQDLYDEVDRRECEKAWREANCPCSPFITLFLPLESHLSSTRNQWRQKLAKSNALQFATLLIDVLKTTGRTPVETDRSANESLILRGKSPKFTARYDDYDEVAGQSTVSPSTGHRTHSASVCKDDTAPLLDDMLELKEKLLTTEQTVAHLTTQNQELTKLVNQLCATTTNINAECVSLREEVARLSRLTLTRRMPSPLTTSDIATPPRPIIPTPILNRPSPNAFPSAFQKREPEERPREEGSRWRSASSDRRNSNDRPIRPDANLRLPPTDQSAQRHFHENGSSNHSGHISRKPNIRPEDLTAIVQQGDLVAQKIRILLQHGVDSTLDTSDNAARCAYDVSRTISQMVSMIPHTFSRDGINDLIDTVVVLNAKCNARQLSPDEICKAAHQVADKLRHILLYIF
ncbi:unnamed protein product [Caenorhabditis auriculariae]|uniref:Arf-GAP domain-containing protein n=1 Tax=Caenorhabditis auriculariae TaxID=2777116 RepID=A0A8S1GZM8_9PELO|nr:unnamed protein product [Caenorhabditis auriculariae]